MVFYKMHFLKLPEKGVQYSLVFIKGSSNAARSSPYFFIQWLEKECC